MKSTKLTLMALGLMFSCFAFTPVAKADGARSYISPTGSDNRQCTRNQPCRTFDGALAKTDEGGEIVALEGNYDPATITKAITLSAAPGADVVIKISSGNAARVAVPGHTTVVLRGLKLSGPGKSSNTKGVFVDVGANPGVRIFVENCDIGNFGTGISALFQESGGAGVHDSVIHDNNSGMVLDTSGTLATGGVVTRTRFERNAIGLAANGNSVDVKDSIATNNGTGFRVNSGGSMILLNCVASKNNVGVDVPGGVVYLSNSMITSNVTGVDSEGVVHSMLNNVVELNEVDFSVQGGVMPRNLH